jgi:DNA-binding NarL/FixJ family response regulator
VSRLPYIQELVRMVGLAELARMEVQAVRVRSVPDRLLVDIALATETGKPSPREMIVLQHLADGEDQPTIARELHVDLETVRSQTRSLRLKLGARNQPQLVVRAIQLGYLQV